MEQNLTNEIVALLIKEDLHARAIAEQLDNNHATVLRKLRDLSDDNIVDFRFEGKNKVFSIRRTIEGRNAVITAELYKQSMAVAKYPVLRKIFTGAIAMQDVPLIILYGSYAKGTATKESDIDIYLETKELAKKKHLEQKHSKLSVKIGMFDPNDLLIREIIKDHVIIRGMEAYFDKTGFFKETA